MKISFVSITLCLTVLIACAPEEEGVAPPASVSAVESEEQDSSGSALNEEVDYVEQMQRQYENRQK